MFDWLVLVYTIPSQPTRKRAYVWRELKRLGALYLRDGVVLLPLQDDLERKLGDVAQRIVEYEGSAYLFRSPQFLNGSADALLDRFAEERAEEYRELYHACVRFLRDVLAEVDAEEFGFPDVDNLESELGRLRRWHDQISARDYFNAAEAERVRGIIQKCDTAFERFAADASTRAVAAAKHEDDVFQRLAGPAPADGEGEELPL